MRSSNGPSSSVRLAVTICRPRCQVVSKVKTMSAIASGNQPPCRTFDRLAARNARSTIRNAAAPATTVGHGLCHKARTTKKNRMVSIVSVPVTAMPYACARLAEDPKPTTSAITATKIPQLIAGTYTCPSWCEVW